MNTPFIDNTAAVAARGPRFFVPGHKGNAAALPFMGTALAGDITEVEGACDLQNPTGPLLQSQQNMARAFGAGATLYSAFGASSAISAMLALFCPAGSTLVAARGAHVAAIRAMAFLDLHPAWVTLKDGLPVPAAIAAALAESGAKAVYITSPDYHGRTADIPAIAAVCRAQGAKLLVDNAHGAHLRFLAKDAHPLTLGADAAADSAHKTLPCLTGAALLHLRDASLEADARAALNLFSSTSPSYLILQSLDWAAGLLLSASPPDFEAAARRVSAFITAHAPIAFPCGDPLRITLIPAAAGYDASAFHAALLAAGIAAEYFDGARLILMASPYNTDADFAALSAALAQSCRTLPYNKEGGHTPPPALDSFTSGPLPATRCSIRAALFGPGVAVPTQNAAGRIMAGLSVPCPPGIPPILPGEEITPSAAAACIAAGIPHLRVLPTGS